MPKTLVNGSSSTYASVVGSGGSRSQSTSDMNVPTQNVPVQLSRSSLHQDSSRNFNVIVYGVRRVSLVLQERTGKQRIWIKLLP